MISSVRATGTIFLPFVDRRDYFQRWSKDSGTQKNFGFGTIDVNDDGSATETGMTSSIADYSGTQHRLKLTLIDNNHFSQTFMMNDVEVTQTYKRM
ncbi:MAG: hypothetical protein HOM90_07720 [Porticoccaceae bacterium]|nr:hypothetical protein [Porticoccaceae bacterium]